MQGLNDRRRCEPVIEDTQIMDKVIVFFCSHTLVALVALLIYKRYFAGVC